MSQYKEWQIQIFNKRTNTYVDDSAAVAWVLTASSPVPITLKADQQGTALANPITASGGRFSFFTAKSVTSIDISVQMASGHSIFAQGLSSSVHRLDIYPEDRNVQTLVIPMTTDVGGTTVQDSGFDLLDNMILRDVAAKITSLGADANVTDATLDVGITGSTNLILAAMPEIATGFVQPLGANTDSVEFAYFGTALATIELGTDTADNGTLIRKLYNTSVETNIVYQHNVTTGSSVLGYILLDYSLAPS